MLFSVKKYYFVWKKWLYLFFVFASFARNEPFIHSFAERKPFVENKKYKFITGESIDFIGYKSSESNNNRKSLLRFIRKNFKEGIDFSEQQRKNQFLLWKFFEWIKLERLCMSFDPEHLYPMRSMISSVYCKLFIFFQLIQR